MTAALPPATLSTGSALPPERTSISAPLHAVPQGTKSGARSAARQLSSTDLLAGAREILIEHSGVCYRLRVTQNDKLILTK